MSRQTVQSVAIPGLGTALGVSALAKLVPRAVSQIVGTLPGIGVPTAVSTVAGMLAVCEASVAVLLPPFRGQTAAHTPRALPLGGPYCSRSPI